MSSIYFAQVQHPVGQGGVHTGWLFDPHHYPVSLFPHFGGPSLFSWAYDCGSNDRSALTNQINTIRGASMNVLFLSHLDGDHVVGVDQLLTTASNVDEVVLPYLADDDWALHLASSTSAGTLSGNFLDLAADPAGWFGARGVRRITYVEGGDEDDEFPGDPDPIEPAGEPGVEGDPERTSEAEHEPVKIIWSRAPDVIAQGDQSAGRAEIVQVQRSAVAAMQSGRQTLNWVLSPFAFRPSPAKLRAFQAMLVAKFGSGLTAKDYAAKARTDPGRADLRECYDKVWKTHNLHSMALYAGPAIPPTTKVRNTAWFGGFIRRIVQPGWLSTGDFDMSVKKRRDSLINYFARYAPMVGQLALPHHGSDLSFDPAILTAFPALTFAIAAVGHNGYGHPGRGVQAAVSSAAVGFVRVDEGPSSLFQIVGSLD
jgi:hypothetical protein